MGSSTPERRENDELGCDRTTGGGSFPAWRAAEEDGECTQDAERGQNGESPGVVARLVGDRTRPCRPDPADHAYDRDLQAVGMEERSLPEVVSEDHRDADVSCAKAKSHKRHAGVRLQRRFGEQEPRQPSAAHNESDSQDPIGWQEIAERGAEPSKRTDAYAHAEDRRGKRGDEAQVLEVEPTVSCENAPWERVG